MSEMDLNDRPKHLVVSNRTCFHSAERKVAAGWAVHTHSLVWVINLISCFCTEYDMIPWEPHTQQCTQVPKHNLRSAWKLNSTLCPESLLAQSVLFPAGALPLPHAASKQVVPSLRALGSSG
jgi:hypothetical protein